MTVALLVICDGRDDYHDRALHSAKLNLPAFDQTVVIDDASHQLGFAGAIQAGWEQIDTDHVFHLEADFTFNQPVPVDQMIAVLHAHPRLAQLVLKRQPWNDTEKAAGGIVEQHPDDYTEKTWCGQTWTEHRRFWSTNPGVYSSRFCRVGWPQEPESEGVFTHIVLRDPHLRFGFWGAKFARPLVHHLGEIRTGVGY